MFCYLAIYDIQLFESAAHPLVTSQLLTGTSKKAKVLLLQFKWNTSEWYTSESITTVKFRILNDLAKRRSLQNLEVL